MFIILYKNIQGLEKYMKIALLGDCHWGIRKNNDIFLESHLRFLKEQFIPELKEKGIDTIIQLGDWFDNRNNINVKVMNAVYDLLANDLKDFKVYVLVGNHDLYFKTTINTHSLQMFKQFPNVTVIDKLQKVTFDKREILLTPWLIDHDEFVQQLSNTDEWDCDVVCGHFEMKGFKLNNKMKAAEGLDCNMFFKKYKLIFSGHYHTISKQKRVDSTIQYVGSMSHLSRHDIGDKRGYFVLDTDTLDYEFFENKKSLKYVKVQYPTKVTKKMIKGNIIDVEVEPNDQFNEDEFQSYLLEIENLGPVFPPIPQYNSKLFTEASDVDIKAMTITEIIKEYVGTIEIENEETKKLVYNKIQSLYEDTRGEL